MTHVTLTTLGRLVILHRDDPSPDEVRRRIEMLLMAHVPKSGLIEVWPGDRPDEVLWRKVRQRVKVPSCG